MARQVKKLGFFEIDMSLAGDVMIYGGEQVGDVEAKRYRTHTNPKRNVVEEVLAKLTKAFHDDQPTIDVVIVDDKWIEGDDAFVFPDLSQHFLAVRESANKLLASVEEVEPAALKSTITAPRRKTPRTRRKR
jgi:hypothetical protein